MFKCECLLFVENVRNLGSHTLQLQVVLNETGATKFAGKTLPSYKFKFTVTGMSSMSAQNVTIIIDTSK